MAGLAFFETLLMTRAMVGNHDARCIRTRSTATPQEALHTPRSLFGGRVLRRLLGQGCVRRRPREAGSVVDGGVGAQGPGAGDQVELHAGQLPEVERGVCSEQLGELRGGQELAPVVGACGVGGVVGGGREELEWTRVTRHRAMVAVILCTHTLDGRQGAEACILPQGGGESAYSEAGAAVNTPASTSKPRPSLHAPCQHPPKHSSPPTLSAPHPWAPSAERTLPPRWQPCRRRGCDSGW